MMTTVDQIMSLHPCKEYSRARVKALWAGRPALSASEIAALPIPVEDRVWALTRLVPRRVAIAWACDCAERILSIWETSYPDDDRPRKAIQVTRAWLRGEATIGEVRDAAYAAAYYAAPPERTNAALYAAYDTVYAAAGATAAAAAATAAYYAPPERAAAAFYAAYDAAYAAATAAAADAAAAYYAAPPECADAAFYAAYDAAYAAAGATAATAYYAPPERADACYAYDTAYAAAGATAAIAAYAAYHAAPTGRAAADYTADDAAYAAAYAAAATAAYAAYAAYHAAPTGRADAAYAASRDEERAWQLGRLVELAEADPGADNPDKHKRSDEERLNELRPVRAGEKKED